MRTVANKPVVRWSAFAIFLILVLVAIFPVLSAPVEADDRYWYMFVPGTARGSYLALIDWTFTEVPSTIYGGRIPTLAFLARRFLALATVQTAAGFTIPIPAAHGMAKAALLAAGIGSIWLFLRALRWRDAAGTCHPLRSTTTRWAMVAIVALIAVGAQTQAPFRNSWVAYPVLTYSAVTVIFGTLALSAWVARKVTSGDRTRSVIPLIPLGLIGVALNFTYELYFVVVPMVPIILYMIPLDADSRAERTARRLTSAAFLVPFVAAFALVRLIVANYCASEVCYPGTVLSLGMPAIRTWGLNLLTAVPLFGQEELAAQISTLGATEDLSRPLSTVLPLVGPILALAVMALLYLLASSPDRSAPDPISGREESRTLMKAALASVAIAVGTALIMAISTRAQEVITALGQPYRNTMVTWISLVVALALGGASVMVRRDRMEQRVLPILTVGLLVAVLGSVSIPHNSHAIRAHRNHPGVQVIERIHWEVVLGDPSAEGDLRRCQLYALAEDTIFTPWIQTSMKSGAQNTSQYLHNLPYCSEWP